MYETAAETYRRVKVTTASGGNLVVLLYEALLTNMKQARSALNAGYTEKAHRHLIRAQEILSELSCSLDMSAGGVAQNLMALYHYCGGLLVKANLKKQAGPVEQAIAIVAPLFDAWRQVTTMTAAAEDNTTTATTYRMAASD